MRQAKPDMRLPRDPVRGLCASSHPLGTGLPTGVMNPARPVAASGIRTLDSNRSPEKLRKTPEKPRTPVVIPSSETAASVRTAPVRTYTFDEFTLDVAARKLLRGGIATPLPSRAFDALVYLVERRQRLVQKNELIDAIWAGVVVTDDSLTH